MPQFLVRVELHDGDSDDYETLHDAMKRRKFSRTLLSAERVKHHLPPAEYIFNGKATADDVCRSAIAAAEETGLKCAVVVAESQEITWFGLKKVTED